MFRFTSPRPSSASARKAGSLARRLTIMSLTATSVAAVAVTAQAAGGRNANGQYPPNGRPPEAAVPFDWTIPAGTDEYRVAPTEDEATAAVVPPGKLLKVLIIGSDARPNEKPEKTRGDSIHLLVWNPALKRGTLVGFPRDSFVPIPGRGTSKINASLAWGGPELMKQAVSNTVGPKLAPDYWILTGFAGFTKMVDDIGGILIQVPSMNDKYSGAQFQGGWYAMNGNAALAFSRARKSLPKGDFQRSANQGMLLKSALASIRERTSDAPGLIKLLVSFRQNAKTSIKTSDLLVWSQLARAMDPAAIDNVVVDGKPAKLGKSDGVVLNAANNRKLFADLETDGIVNQK